MTYRLLWWNFLYCDAKSKRDVPFSPAIKLVRHIYYVPGLKKKWTERMEKWEHLYCKKVPY